MMKIILLGMILSMMIIPVFAQENTTAKIEELEIQINHLITENISIKNTNEELNQKIQNLDEQILELQDHGIKFGIDEIKLGKTITESQPVNDGWTKGDLIIASSTIFAFFTFGSFLVIKFESTKKDDLVELTRETLAYILIIQITHLVAIFIIIFWQTATEFYAYIVIITMIFLILAFLNVRRIITLENQETIRRQSSDQWYQDELQSRVDDLSRENKRLQREEGE